MEVVRSNSNVADLGVQNPEAERWQKLTRIVMLITIPLSLSLAAAFADALIPIAVLSMWIVVTVIGSIFAGLAISDSKDNTHRKACIAIGWCSLTLPGMFLLCFWSLLSDAPEPAPVTEAPSGEATPGYDIQG